MGLYLYLYLQWVAHILCKLCCVFAFYYKQTFPISGGEEREMMMMMTLIVVVVVVERYGVSMKLALSQFRAQKLLHFEMEEHWWVCNCNLFIYEVIQSLAEK